MKFENVKHKFGGWADYFKEFIGSEAFDDIFARLKWETGRGRIICPQSQDTFRVFTETDPKDLRCIFILQDPYPWVQWIKGDKKYVADGLAMSCSNTGICQPSLTQFYQGMEKELCGGMNLEMEYCPDLSYLAKQGVMLLNCSLTVEKDKPGSHLDLWRPFTRYFIEEILNNYFSGLPIAFFGQGAAKLEPLIAPFIHWTRVVIHPAAAAHKGTNWDSKGLFTWVNTLIEQNNGPEFKINWYKIQS